MFENQVLTVRAGLNSKFKKSQQIMGLCFFMTRVKAMSGFQGRWNPLAKTRVGPMSWVESANSLHFFQLGGRVCVR